MTLKELYNELKNRKVQDTHYIVALKYKYDFEKEYTIENQLLEVDYDDTAHIPDVVFTWENDWYEGQTDIEVLGYVTVDEVQVVKPHKNYIELSEKDALELLALVQKIMGIQSPSIIWASEGKYRYKYDYLKSKQEAEK